LVRDKVCLDRIAKFLDGDEIEPLTNRALPPSSLPPNTTPSEQPALIGFENATFVWPMPEDVDGGSANDTDNAVPTPPSETTMVHREFTLRGLSIRFPVGKLSLITGPTGSGKTSMLLALLGGNSPMALCGGHGLVIPCCRNEASLWPHPDATGERTHPWGFVRCARRLVHRQSHWLG